MDSEEGVEILSNISEKLTTEERQSIFLNENPIWRQLSKSMNSPIEPHICQILHITGYKSYQALKDITDQDISDMESFVRGDQILDHIDSSDVDIYLGTCKKREKFSFLPGEKKLIRSIAAFVKEHHSECSKPISSVPLFSMFKKSVKRASNSFVDHGKRSKPDDGTVVSYDISKEILKVKKLMKDGAYSKGYPKVLCDSIPSLNIEVKTMENSEQKGKTTLKAIIPCPLCKKKQTGFIDSNGYWSLGNINRHLKNHNEKGDFKDMGALEKSVSSVLEPIIEIQEEESAAEYEPSQEFINASEVDEPSEDQASKAASSSKWKSQKYSRLERARRKLGRHIPGQLRMTAFYPILDQVDAILQSNQEIISALSARVQELSAAVNNPEKVEMPALLQMLMDAAKKNTYKEKHGNRYEIDIKYFSSYLFIIAGPLAYEFLSKNMSGAMLSISDVEKFLSKTSEPVTEGKFRFAELKEYLSRNNLPLKVWVSEDGTRIIQRFSYDVKSNQIIGPTLPLDHNGVPIINSFPAESAAMIATHFLKGVPASSAYAIMAQPLQKGAPSFCLAIFGTDNKFTSNHVFKRWIFIKENLANIGVEVVGYSSDGDPKLLSAMHAQMFQNNCPSFNPEWDEWFYASGGLDFTVMQDAIHTVNKFRARLTPGHLLPMGNYVASQTHLRIVTKRDKSEHGLTLSDLDKNDKMDFNSSVKICSSRVTEIMKEHVPGSEATQAYLKVMRFIMEAVMDENISASEKIYKIWYSVLFLRYWKSWLMDHSSHTLDNFVTTNAYMCVEIIAHAIIILIVKFRDSNRLQDALFELFDSQDCESFFRYARSMTSTQSTVINFSMQEFLFKVRRIDILQNIISKMRGRLEFPRDKRKYLRGLLRAEKLSSSYLPNNDEICQIVGQAKSDVFEDLQRIGIKCRSLSLLRVKAAVQHCRSFQLEGQAIDPCPDDGYSVEFSEDDIPLDILLAFPSPDEIPDLNPLDSEATPHLPPNSTFVYVPNSSKRLVRMKKSTFCWMLSAEGTALDKERLMRVRGKVHCSMSNSQHVFKSLSQIPAASKNEEIEVGEWVIFKEGNKFIVGQVMGFCYLSGAKTYSLLKAPTTAPLGKAARGLGCMCVWYKVNDQLKLKERKLTTHKYVNMDHYVCSVSPPSLDDNVLKLHFSAAEFLE